MERRQDLKGHEADSSAAKEIVFVRADRIIRKVNVQSFPSKDYRNDHVYFACRTGRPKHWNYPEHDPGSIDWDTDGCTSSPYLDDIQEGPQPVPKDRQTDDDLICHRLVTSLHKAGP